MIEIHELIKKLYGKVSEKEYIRLERQILNNIDDNTGRTFGRLYVKRLAIERCFRDFDQKINTYVYECICKCTDKEVDWNDPIIPFKIKYIKVNNLRRGVESCGCLRKDCIKKARPYKNLNNKKFGKLTVIREDKVRSAASLLTNNPKHYWICICECKPGVFSKEISVEGTKLKTKRTKSCVSS